MQPEIKGSCFGIEITKREKGQTDLITLFIEDDGYWHQKESFAAFWIDDLIKVLKLAKRKADCEIRFERVNGE